MKLNLREPSFFIGHRGSVPLCPRLNCVRTQRTASESYARRLHKMAILCHSLINIKVENLSAFSYLRKRFFLYLCNPFRPEKMAEENLLITYIKDTEGLSRCVLRYTIRTKQCGVPRKQWVCCLTAQRTMWDFI